MRNLARVLLLLLFTVQSIAQNKVEILWLGMENLVSFKDTTIKYPLFKSSDASVKRESEKFIVTVTNPKSVGQTIQIEMYDSLSNDTKKISTYYFRVKAVPYPTFYIDSTYIHDTISRAGLLNIKKIDVRMDDPEFNFYFPFEIQSFDMEIDGKTFHSNSNALTTSMIYYVNNSQGNKIRILNDKSIMTNGSDRTARCVACGKTFILVK